MLGRRALIAFPPPAVADAHQVRGVGSLAVLADARRRAWWQWQRQRARHGAAGAGLMISNSSLCQREKPLRRGSTRNQSCHWLPSWFFFPRDKSCTTIARRLLPFTQTVAPIMARAVWGRGLHGPATNDHPAILWRPCVWLPSRPQGSRPRAVAWAGA